MDELRIGDADREDALRKLGEHLGAGRLDIDEHSERSTRIFAARTLADIRKEFVDLPAPHPDLEHMRPATTGDSSAIEHVRPGAGRPSVPQRRGAAIRNFAGDLTAVVWIVSIILMMATQVGWWVILIPVAYSALLSAWSRASGDHHGKASPTGKPSS